MSLRGKTQKAKKFGTPTTPSVTTPKAPSPKKPKIVRTATGGVVSVSTPKAPRTAPRTDFGYGVTPTAAGIAVQEQFKSQIQTLTAPIRNTITALQQRLADQSNIGARLQGYAYEVHLEDQKKLEELIHQKEADIIEVELDANVKQIIEAIESGKVLAPDYFHNNIIWVKSGQISNKAFLDSYYYLSNQGIIHSAPIEPIIEEIIEEPIIELPELLPEVSAEPDITITDNMVTQQLINFNIVNGRAVGSIKFVATNNFNPYYYGKNIFNIIQIKDPNGANILTYVKENRLNFTETEPDEIISYNEDMKGNTRATVESFVWSSATTPTAFSKMYSIEISEAEPPKPITTGFMSAGIAGAIAGLVLIGFIADHKRGK
jgi:hypothetical protein